MIQVVAMSEILMSLMAPISKVDDLGFFFFFPQDAFQAPAP